VDSLPQRSKSGLWRDLSAINRYCKSGGHSDTRFAEWFEADSAIANTAAFHFGTIEQGGSSLYSSMLSKVTDLTVLNIVTSIGGTEVFHFAIWNDGAGNVPAVHVPGLTFPDIATVFEGDELREKDLIMPEPRQFIDSRPAALFHNPAHVGAASGRHGGGYRLDHLGSFHRSKPGILPDAE
jgi:hypothetical protein